MMQACNFTGIEHLLFTLIKCEDILRIIKNMHFYCLLFYNLTTNSKIKHTNTAACQDTLLFFSVALIFQGSSLHLLANSKITGTCAVVYCAEQLAQYTTVQCLLGSL